MKLYGYGGCCKAMQCLEHWSDEVWTAEWRNLMLDFRIFEKAESLWGCEGPQGFDSIRFDSIQFCPHLNSNQIRNRIKTSWNQIGSTISRAIDPRSLASHSRQQTCVRTEYSRHGAERVYDSFSLFIRADDIKTSLSLFSPNIYPFFTFLNAGVTSYWFGRSFRKWSELFWWLWRFSSLKPQIYLKETY